MNKRHRRAAAAVLALAAAGALTVVALAAPPSTTEPTEVLKWEPDRDEHAARRAGGVDARARRRSAVGRPDPPGDDAGAVYDAVNATEPKHYRPYLLKRRFGATASKDAAVATAAYEVLSSIVRGVPQTIPYPNRQAVLDGLSAAYEDSLDAIDDSPFKKQGIAAGHAAAEAMIAAGGRRPLRAVAVERGPERRPQPDPGRALSPQLPGRIGAIGSDAVGRRSEAVPDRELVAVPQRRP